MLPWGTLCGCIGKKLASSCNTHGNISDSTRGASAREAKIRTFILDCMAHLQTYGMKAEGLSQSPVPLLIFDGLSRERIIKTGAKLGCRVLFRLVLGTCIQSKMSLSSDVAFWSSFRRNECNNGYLHIQKYSHSVNDKVANTKESIIWDYDIYLWKNSNPVIARRDDS